MLVVALLLGAVNWIATTIIVESELTRPLRERVQHPKLRYLVGCHLCTGTWVGLAEACFVTIGLSSGLPGIVLSALCYKAVGHTVLNVNARLSP